MIDAEKTYRRLSVLKHIKLTKLMQSQGLPSETVEREKRLVGFLFQLYREA